MSVVSVWHTISPGAEDWVTRWVGTGKVFLQWIQFPTVCKGYFPLRPRWILSQDPHSEWKAEAAFLNETTFSFAVFEQSGSPAHLVACCNSVKRWNSHVPLGSCCDRRPGSPLCILLLKMFVPHGLCTACCVRNQVLSVMLCSACPPNHTLEVYSPLSISW